MPANRIGTLAHEKLFTDTLHEDGARALAALRPMLLHERPWRWLPPPEELGRMLGIPVVTGAELRATDPVPLLLFSTRWDRLRMNAMFPFRLRDDMGWDVAFADPAMTDFFTVREMTVCGEGKVRRFVASHEDIEWAFFSFSKQRSTLSSFQFRYYWWEKWELARRSHPSLGSLAKPVARAA